MLSLKFSIEISNCPINGATQYHGEALLWTKKEDPARILVQVLTGSTCVPFGKSFRSSGVKCGGRIRPVVKQCSRVSR